MGQLQRFFKCQRCGGQVILPSLDGVSCFQCGAEHTKQGQLMTSLAISLKLAKEEKAVSS